MNEQFLLTSVTSLTWPESIGPHRGCTTDVCFCLLQHVHAVPSVSAACSKITMINISLLVVSWSHTKQQVWLFYTTDWIITGNCCFGFILKPLCVKTIYRNITGNSANASVHMWDCVCWPFCLIAVCIYVNLCVVWWRRDRMWAGRPHEPWVCTLSIVMPTREMFDKQIKVTLYKISCRPNHCCCHISTMLSF